ncbi:MAG: glycoside hydrolase family 3 protein [Proteobacteria bacterium]|nr:glycoside hydrolase family 3 protein [Pseudomonadota bacterium]
MKKIFIAGILTALILTGCDNSDNSPQKQEAKQCSKIVAAALCQKIGQLLIVGFGGVNVDQHNKITWIDPNGLVFKQDSNIAKDIADWHIGGVILFRGYLKKKDNEFIRFRNIQNGPQVTNLNKALQAYNNKTRDQQQLRPLPLLISLDQEGGLIDSLSFAPIQNYTAQALGTNEEMVLNDPQKRQQALNFTYNRGKVTGMVLKNYGFNLDFAPDVDVNINPVNPIIGGLSRSYSSNPEIVAEQANQMINGLHTSNILSVIKHFPGHGSSTGDSHKGLVDVTHTYQMELELAPYKKLISNGYNDFVMSTHVINGQVDRSQCLTGNPEDPGTWCPGTMSQKTLTGLLRNQLHFTGVIISDDMAMGAIANQYPLSVALEKSLNAGVDMFIISNHHADNTGDFVITIAKLVKEGKVPESRIEDAYQHGAGIKQRLMQ